VLRLASLLWRLRRSTTIETDLFEIQAEALRERRLGVALNQTHGAVFRAFEGPFVSTNSSRQEKGQGLVASRELPKSIKLTALTIPAVILPAPPAN
jgi:hypothetical protein